ncbi:MAG TPA: hypothetical protein VGR37_11685 [Longimicrobiaceae bacterium]|nr:hypothetical protein [Longimicrobiaceae bacterium]
MRAKRLFWVPVLAAGLVIGGCTAEQTQEGELPDVDVKGGQAPAYDVDAADVDVTTDTQTVVTPDVDVNPPR